MTTENGKGNVITGQRLEDTATSQGKLGANRSCAEQGSGHPPAPAAGTGPVNIHLDFSPITFVSDFWPLELEDNKLCYFKPLSLW